MIITGLLGIRFDIESLSFAAFLPEEIGLLGLRDVANHDLKMYISIENKGHTI